MRVPRELIKVIDSYLTHSSFSVQMDGALSEWKPILAGVPQGFTLSPKLYNLYTSEIPKSIRSKLAEYADDIFIYDQNKSPRFAHLTVQRHLNELGRWESMWPINISAEKTKAVVFSKKSRLQLPELKIQSAKIDYLGIILDHRLTCKKHCEVLRGTDVLDSHKSSKTFASLPKGLFVIIQNLHSAREYLRLSGVGFNPQNMYASCPE